MNSESEEIIEPKEQSFLEESFTLSQVSKTHQCDVCLKCFNKKYNLQRHVKSHNKEDKPRCSECNQFFGNQEDFMEHMSKKHANENICELCGAKSKRKNDLRVHMIRVHNLGVARFSCPFEGCTKTFYQESVYQDHQNLHTGAKPYQCSYCPKAFSHRYTKPKHEKLCKLKMCNKCAICAKEYDSADGLKEHENACHGGIMYTCDCGFAYKYRSGLRRHKKKSNH